MPQETQSAIHAFDIEVREPLRAAFVRQSALILDSHERLIGRPLIPRKQIRSPTHGRCLALPLRFCRTGSRPILF